jgi:hypothetical protein
MRYKKKEKKGQQTFLSAMCLAIHHGSLLARFFFCRSSVFFFLGILQHLE